MKEIDSRSQATIETWNRGQPQATGRHLLHVFASFGLGGVPIRICDVLNALPEGFRHTIVSLDSCFDARKRLGTHVDAGFRDVRLARYCLPCNVRRFVHLIKDIAPDLLLTYNWGAIECALTHRLSGTCDHIHFESGFGSEEANGQLLRRSLFRRLALGRVRKLVVPSKTLMTIARESWRISPSKLVHIPNGVDLLRYRGRPGEREEGNIAATQQFDTVIGTVAPLRPEKNIGRLLRAFGKLPRQQSCGLVIAGAGPELEHLRRLAADLRIADRTHFLGHVEDVPALLRSIDVFVLSSDTEQMPNSLLQAMAAARPVAGVDVGDVKIIVSPENRSLIVPREDEDALTSALSALIADPARREKLGRINQEHIKAHYGLDGMVGAYRDLLSGG
jgi:glycosyltransferase involved in cell wall biosynthesis